MKNQLLGGVVGGIILFVWGALVWMVLPLHTTWMKTASNDEAVTAAMQQTMAQKGVYFLPGMPVKEGKTPEQFEAAQKEYAGRVSAGPQAMVIYDPAGMDASMARPMLLGLLNSMFAAFLASWLLARSTAFSANYLARVAFCGVLGIFVSSVIHLVNLNWFNYPLDFTVAMIVDTVGGWVLAGLGIGAIVRYKEPVPGPTLAV